MLNRAMVNDYETSIIHIPQDNTLLMDSTFLKVFLNEVKMHKGAIMIGQGENQSQLLEQIGLEEMEKEVLDLLCENFPEEGVHFVPDVLLERSMVKFSFFFKQHKIRSFILGKIVDSSGGLKGMVFLADSTARFLDRMNLSNLQLLMSLSVMCFHARINENRFEEKKKKLELVNNDLASVVHYYVKNTYTIAQRLSKTVGKLNEKNCFFWDDRDKKYIEQLTSIEKDIYEMSRFKCS